MNLAKYDAARYALSAAVEVDEVKDIRDKAEAMAAYARQAKDTEMVKWATEIKVRAERKAGQMLAEMPKNPGNLQNSSRSHDATTTKTLYEMGITKSDSSRWQKLAAVSESQFDQAIEAAREIAGEVTTAAMLRATQAEKPKVELDQVEPEYTDLDAAKDQIADLQVALATASMGDVPESEKTMAKDLIEILRAEVHTLTQTLKAANSSRDALMQENAQLKRQCQMNRKELEKLKAK